ncbi:MAG: alpha/beta hydrolase family protein [Vicinamibacterales bacterium]
MQGLRYCTAALLAAVALPCVGPAEAQQAPAPVPAAGEATYIVFLGGREIGREQVSLSRTASGWTITSSGKLAAPLNFTNKRFQLTYAPDWQPIELEIDAAVQDNAMALSTSFGTTTAINEITQKGVTNTKTDQISARSVVLPNNFYGAYEALAVRLASAPVGADLPVYVVPQGEIRLVVKSITPSTYETPAGTMKTRKYSVTFQNPGGPLNAEVTIDDRHRFAKLEIGAGSLAVARQDLAGVATRQHTLRNPTDVDVVVPASGFSLAGTLTTPPAQGRLKHPAIVLVAGSGPLERDSTVAGIPLFAQLAGQLAELGYTVLRYDKRGVGKSGGRVDTVTLQDYADDVIAAVKWLDRRKDVDDRRISVVGHSEGAAVAMLAAREKRVASVVLIAGMGTTGRELILEQQQSLLSAANVAEPDRTDKVDLQKKILDATVTEEGWDALPPEVRRAADTPWYRSLLTFDPAKVMPRIKQPVFILQGGLDKQVPPHHADRLADMARARKKTPRVEVEHFPTLNHLMVPAKTGGIAEYASLETRTVDAGISKTIADWLSTVAR